MGCNKIEFKFKLAHFPSKKVVVSAVTQLLLDWNTQPNCPVFLGAPSGNRIGDNNGRESTVNRLLDPG